MRWLAVFLMAGCGGASSAPDAGPEVAPPTIEGEVEVSLQPRAGSPDAVVTVFASHEGWVLDLVEGQVGELVRVGVAPGSTVTAVYQSSDATSVVSVHGTMPGDSLIAGDGTPPDQGPRPSIQIDWPAAGLEPYALLTACSAISYQSTSPTLLFDAACEPDATTDVLVRDTPARGWARIEDVPLGSTAQVPPLQPYTSFAVTLENADLGAWVEVSSVIDGHPARTWTFQKESTPGTTLEASATDWAPADETWIRLVTHSYRGVVHGDVLAPGETAWTFDRAQLSRMYEGFGVNSEFMYWTALTDDYDGAVVVQRWSRGVRRYQWVVVAPPTETITYPALPDHLQAVIPVAGDNLEERCFHVVDFHEDAGYDDMRRRPEWQVALLRAPDRPGSWNSRYTADQTCIDPI